MRLPPDLVGPDAGREQTETLVTPEGVPLTFALATRGQRFTAFFLDVLIILLTTAVLWALFSAAVADRRDASWLGALVLIVNFLLQTFYFIFTEARGRGTTPGKRAVGIRVVDARGGPLTTDAILVRNLLRAIEVWLPLTALFAPREVLGGAPGWVWLIVPMWILGVSGMPLFNRRNLRLGDLAAGTLVVRAPRAALLQDLGAAAATRPAQEQARHVFTRAQLEAYGIYELQVLEEVLRSDRELGDRHETLRAVAQRIARKIDWEPRPSARDSAAFLRDYYAALRSHLEQRLLLGKRKKDKYAKD